jgi:glycosyltransferase involved in cell wall biosynthesis
MNESVRRDRIVLPPKTKPRVLISTIEPGVGGVGTHLRCVLSWLRDAGFETVVAFYAPFRRYPKLSVPSFRPLPLRPGCQLFDVQLADHAFGIGSYLPELEFMHYRPHALWRDLIALCDAHLVVSGTVIAGTAIATSRRRGLAWIGSDWEGDRQQRAKSFGAVRRMVDWLLVRPFTTRLERQLLSQLKTVVVSNATRQAIETLRTDRAVRAEVIPIPIDCNQFRPDASLRVPKRIGFAGRFDDPRKNISLFVETIAKLRKLDSAVSGLLVGGAATNELTELISDWGLTDSIQILSALPSNEYTALLATLDIFFLPSHQEGLCIAALEAMACGVPVVSTRCGGPEEFVIPGKTGALVDFSAESACDEIAKLLADTSLRDRLGRQARRFVEDNYSIKVARESFWRAFDSTFPTTEHR